MPIHRCTPEELGFGDPEKSTFFPTHKNAIRTLDYYHKKFMCIDSDLQLQGDYNSDKASLFKIVMKTCSPDDEHIIALGKTCKSEDEIKEWMKRKYVVVLNNQQRFNAD